MKLKNKDGIAPVIAVVLLIGLALMIGSLIFIFGKSIINIEQTLFSEPIENSCEGVDIEVEAIGNENKIYIVNRGNVPLYGIQIKEIGIGNIVDVATLSLIILPGETSNASLPSIFQTINLQNLIVVPILKSDYGDKKEFVCNDKNIKVYYSPNG